MFYKLKQRYDCLDIAIIICRLKTGHDKMAIPDVEEVAHVSSYPLLGYMVFDTSLSGGVEK